MAIGMYDANIVGKGYGSEAIRLLLQYAFADLDLHRIGVRVLAYNHRAIRRHDTKVLNLPAFLEQRRNLFLFDGG